MLDDSLFPRFKESLLGGKYNLLLGAGVSMDSTDRHGKNLPNSEKFRQDLCTLKSVHESTSLPLVYGVLEQDEIRKHVVDRFLGCRPGPTVKDLTNFLWRFVYTFNIDDALEAAFDAKGGLAKQRLSTVNFDTSYDSGSLSLADLRVLHLHGYVREPGSGFVFSHNEYVKVMKEINPWMVVLSQVLATEPFLIAGTRLGEPDLEFYLSTRNKFTPRAARGPSLLVEPYPDAVTRKACDVHGLTLVEATLADFLNWVLGKVGTVPGYAAHLPTDKSVFTEPIDQRKLASFFSDFAFVSLQSPLGHPSDLSFFYGRPPTWADIANRIDIDRSDTFELVETCRNLLKDNFSKERLVLVTAPAGSGKTTLAKRAAFDLLEDGHLLFDCRSTARIDPGLAIECLSKLNSSFLIFVDDFADHVEQLRPLLETEDIGARFIVLACERDYRVSYIDLILDEMPRTVREMKGLSSQQRTQLTFAFRKHGLLGSEYATKKPEEFAKLAHEVNIAIFVCRLLNDLRPLDRIASSLFRDAEDFQQVTYAACALAQHCHRVGVSYKILQSLNRQHKVEHQIADKNPLPLAYNIDNDDYVLPLNNILASRVVDMLSKEHPKILFRVFVELAKAVVPHVTRRNIMNKTPEAKLAGRLFDADKIVRPLLGMHGAEFYEAVKDICSWNSRYWEQRALYLADDDLPTAVQYARHAAALEQHPFTYTTLGKLLIKQMRAPGANREYLFSEAYSKLTSAINQEQQFSRISIHPFVMLFIGSTTFLELGGVLSPQQHQLITTHLNFAKYRYRRDNELQNAASRLEVLLAPV